MKKFLVAFCILVVLTLCVSCAKEQYEHFGGIHGTVVDHVNGEQVYNAHIVLSPGGRFEQTGSDGYYQFNNLEPRQYSVSVQHSEYRTDRKTVTVRIGESALVNFSLVKE